MNERDPANIVASNTDGLEDPLATPDEHYQHLLENIKTIVWYWSQQPLSKQECCDGVAFSILSLLDGCNLGAEAVYTLFSHSTELRNLHEGYHNAKGPTGKLR